MNPIDSVFRRLRAEKRKALISFITAGDPNLEATSAVLAELARHADLIEIGFPYSDPIADGPVIQASYTRALGHGTRVDEVLDWAGRLATTQPFADGGVPRVAMISYSLAHRRGPETFVRDAESAGFSGLIVPDLPMEEGLELGRICMEHDIKLIPLVTPTTPRERARQIIGRATGFVYCVSVKGITGERDTLPKELLAQLHALREETSLPLCAGFGISNPDHVRMLREAVDGVIVGSAFVRYLESAGSRPLAEVIGDIGRLAGSLQRALNPPRDPKSSR
jgi:tryptophan synthase alpha chain